uniref:CCR4-NOT transcription complex subunit 11 n=1 Tax=Acrobeloides nanus TaxID=290746 RepID=A0A914BUV3_9BILA
MFISPEDEIELKKMFKDCFSVGYNSSISEFIIVCLKQFREPNFDALMKMDFYQQALKNIEENKAHLAMYVQAIIFQKPEIPSRLDGSTNSWIQRMHKFMILLIGVQ